MFEVENLSTVSDLASQFQSGEAAAGDALANQLRLTLVKRFLGLGISTHDAEDLSQQCLVDVFSCFDRFDSDKGSVEAWTSGVARNVLRNWWRRSAAMKQTETSTDAVLDMPAPEAPEGDAVAAISEALVAVSVIDRELLHMRFALGMSFAEISAASDLTEANARKRVSRSVEQLRRHGAIQALLA